MGMYICAEEGYVHSCGLSEYSTLEDAKASREKYAACFGEIASKSLNSWVETLNSRVEMKEDYEAAMQKRTATA